MKKLLLTFWCCLLALAANAVTATFKASDYSDGESTTAIVDKVLTTEGHPISITFAKGEGGSAPIYYKNGTSFRFYAQNTLTVAGENVTITKITFTTSKGNLMATGTSADSGDMNDLATTTPYWEGAAESVVITEGNGQARISKIEVEYENAGVVSILTAPKEVLLYVNKPFALNATVNSGATLSYSSSDTGVATVDADGVVTGVAEGDAVITINAPAIGDYNAASVTVSVHVSALPEYYEFVFKKGDLDTSATSYTHDGVEWTLSATENQWNSSENQAGYVFGSANNTKTLTISAVFNADIEKVEVTGRSHKSGQTAKVSVKVGDGDDAVDFAAVDGADTWNNGNNQTLAFVGNGIGTVAVTITPDACGYVLAGIKVYFVQPSEEDPEPAAVECASVADFAGLKDGALVKLNVEGAHVTYVSDQGAVVELYAEGEYAGAVSVYGLELKRGYLLSGYITGTLGVVQIDAEHTVYFLDADAEANAEAWLYEAAEFEGEALSVAEALDPANLMRLVTFVDDDDTLVIESYGEMLYIYDEELNELYAMAADTKYEFPENVAAVTGVLMPYMQMGVMDDSYAGGAPSVILLVRDENDVVEAEAEPAVVIPEVKTIAALKELGEGAQAVLSLDGAKVTYLYQGLAIVEDATGAVALFDEAFEFEAGKAITAFLEGKYTEANGFPMFITTVDEEYYSAVDADVTVGKDILVENAFLSENHLCLVTFTVSEYVELVADTEENIIGINKKLYTQNGDEEIEVPQLVKSVTGIIMPLPSVSVGDGETPANVVLIVRDQKDIVVPEVVNNGQGDINAEDWITEGETKFAPVTNYSLRHKENDDKYQVYVKFNDVDEFPAGFAASIKFVKGEIECVYTLHQVNNWWSVYVSDGSAEAAANAPARAASNLPVWNGGDNFDFQVLCSYEGGTSVSPLYRFSHEEYLTGIEAVGEGAAEAVYYNLQGVRVANPQSGNVYIRICGDSASKVLVK